jgi:hypothetical protein
MVRIRCNAKVDIGALETIFLLVPVPWRAALCLGRQQEEQKQEIHIV